MSQKKVLRKPRPLPPLGSYKQSWVHTHRKLCDLSSLLINDKNNNFGKLTQQPTDTRLQFQLDEQARGETKKEEWSPPARFKGDREPGKTMKSLLLPQPSLLLFVHLFLFLYPLVLLKQSLLLLLQFPLAQDSSLRVAGRREIFFSRGKSVLWERSTR